MLKSNLGLGEDMTLCIAAISRQAPHAHIVTVSDLMLSSEYVSVETRITKVEPVSPKRAWMMMFAGSPTPINSLHLQIKQRLEGKDETEAEVRTAAEEVYRHELCKKIEGAILNPMGIDRATFLRRGRAYLGDQEFSRVLYEVNSCDLGVELILAGFEPNGWPRIFSIGNPGKYESHERLGFYAVGTGSLRALGSLYTSYEATLSKAELVYRACEAKFVGESAFGVGKQTYVLTLRQDMTYEALNPPEVDRVIRPEWERIGKPPVPPNMTQKIEASLKRTEWQTPKPRG
jgi:hypothetical protein